MGECGRRVWGRRARASGGGVEEKRGGGREEREEREGEIKSEWQSTESVRER